jgi:hypothetical protein
MENKKFRSEYCSHYPILIKAVQETTGPVLELGTGVFSTPLLHWICGDRKLVSCESHPEYIDFLKQYETENHLVWKITEFWEIPTRFLDDNKYGVVFIDHSPKRPRQRADDAIRFVDSELVVLHDTGRDLHKYGYERVFPLFKYRYDKNNTTVLSNYIDVTKWEV